MCTSPYLTRVLESGLTRSIQWTSGPLSVVQFKLHPDGRRVEHPPHVNDGKVHCSRGCGTWWEAAEWPQSNTQQGADGAQGVAEGCRGEAAFSWPGRMFLLLLVSVLQYWKDDIYCVAKKCCRLKYCCAARMVFTSVIKVCCHVYQTAAVSKNAEPSASCPQNLCPQKYWRILMQQSVSFETRIRAICDWGNIPCAESVTALRSIVLFTLHLYLWGELHPPNSLQKLCV